MDWFNADDKMTVMQKAKICLTEFNKKVTDKQRKLMGTGEVAAAYLSYEERYERVMLLTFVEGLNKVINIHENMPPPQDPVTPIRKKWEPENYRD